MTITISVPAFLPTEPELEVQPEATSVLTDVRAAASSTSDVASWARANGAPADFTGRAADAAEHAVTRFADDTDAVTAALEKGALAIDRFLTAMARRRSEHADLMERRSTLNNQRQALLDRIEGATEADVPSLQAEAEALRGRVDAYQGALEAWRQGIRSDEDAAIAALQAVDTVAEGDSAAGDTDRVDTAALASRLQQLGTDTDAVNAWWQGLSEAERNALLISDPDLVGNTNGIPTGDRDEGNRAAVQRDIEHLQGLKDSGQDLSAAEQRWLDNALAIEEAVAQAGQHPYDHLDLEAYVLAYQPHAFGGDGIAAVSFGNPDTAAHTAVYVPGIMNDGTRIDENAADALLLHDEATSTGASVATITWIGYDSPNWNPESMAPWHLGESAGDAAQTVTEENAEQGGHLLSQFVDGLNSTHESGDQPHLTVIGHSYGSTTSAHAAADGMEADSLVLIGSPGAGGGVDHVSELGMPEGQVFVGARDNDPVSWLGGRDGLLPWTWDDGLGLGEDPAQSDFGAHVFEVGPGQELEGLGGLATDGFLENHTTYFQDPQALANMTSVVIGNDHEVVDTGGRTKDAHDHLFDWGRDELQESYDEHVQPVVDDVVETYEGVRDGAVQTYQDVRDGAVRTYEDVRDGAVRTYEDVRDEAVQTYDEVRDGVDDALDGGREAWDDFWRDPWP